MNPATRGELDRYSQPRRLLVDRASFSQAVHQHYEGHPMQLSNVATARMYIQVRPSALRGPLEARQERIVCGRGTCAWQFRGRALSHSSDAPHPFF